MAVKCAIYCRISTDEDLQKWSLGGQRNELSELALRRGWEVAEIYIDTISGSKSNRPGLDRLRDDMSKGKFSVILVVDQDRLSRLEPVDWELLKKEIREAGVRLVTPVQEVNFSDEDCELVSDVFNLFARHQRRKIKKAMRRGRAEAVNNGKWLGKPPYGRKINIDTGKLDIDPSVGPVVQKIFEMYASGMGTGIICNELNMSLILTPGGSNIWEQTTVIRILGNVVHRGNIERFENGKEIVIPNAFEPTVPPELFDKCNEILRIRGEEYRWHKLKQVTNLCASVLYCTECGKHFNVTTNKISTKYKDTEYKYTYYYYRHRPRVRGKAIKPDCNCSHRVDQIDSRIIEVIKLIGSTPEAARRFIKFRNTTQEKKQLQNRLDNLKKKKNTLLQKKKKLLDLYLEEDWEKSYLDEQRKMLDAQLGKNKREQFELEEKLSQLSQEQMDIDLIVEYFAALANIDSEMSREQQREFVQAVFPRIEIDREVNLTITARIPLDDLIAEAGCENDHASGNYFCSQCDVQGI